MNRRGLAKKGFMGLCGALLGSFSRPKQPDTPIVELCHRDGANWHQLLVSHGKCYRDGKQITQDTLIIVNAPCGTIGVDGSIPGAKRYIYAPHSDQELSHD